MPRSQPGPVVLTRDQGPHAVTITVEEPDNCTALPLLDNCQSVDPISVEEIDCAINRESCHADPELRNSGYRIPRRPLKVAPKPTINKLNKKKDKLLSNKIAAKRTAQVSRNKRYCKLCDTQCNSAKTYFDHVQSRKHKTKVENKRNTPRCTLCDRLFESHAVLTRHINGKYHLQKVYERRAEN